MPARRIQIRGTVQGVGFRPFVYRQATKRNLTGFVLNDLGGVTVHLEGTLEAVEGFLEALKESPPPAARITGIEVREAEEHGYTDFKITESKVGEASQSLEVSADLATCQECRREILDPRDRRYGYAFTNCTDCGPRYTIISELPYDRPKTTMATFRMCPDCTSEYEDPLDRRFHAQPNACPACGPELVLFDARGRAVRCPDPVKETVNLLASGKIVAVKGLGGYHLMCDALSPETVAELRRRKRRPHKALALMCRDVEQARVLAEVSSHEESALRSPAAPILLLRWNPQVSRKVRDAIAPLNPGVGIMLAYTPVHHLLFATPVSGTALSLGPLIATSANLGDEPIISEECELFAKLADVFDAVLAHNRPVRNRIDDSVGFIEPKRSERPRTLKKKIKNHGLCIVRRARGFAPAPFETPLRFPSLLAVGAEMKGSFALSDCNRVWLSPHIGELTNRETIGFFETTLGTYLHWFRVKPEAVACDMHPDYLSSRWAERYAEENDIPLIRVQHHHAHIAAVMFEHRIDEPVIGLSLDGTGYGPAGSIWGCELLYVPGEGDSFERLGRLRGIPLVGGEAAILNPVRMAAGVIADIFGKEKATEIFGKEGERAARQLESGIGVIKGVSSAGRLFDVVAGLLGLVREITFEAQAPIALESFALDEIDRPYRFEIGSDMILDPEPALEAILDEIKKGSDLTTMSSRFHIGFAQALASWVELAAAKLGTRTVCCSGGVFANRSLARILGEKVREKNLTLYLPNLIPVSDGGLSIGQLLVARSLM
ncbi:carbamoyltransferase HypF [candidate division WOR-3 bacterium]|nr:carbamoyltransferase HypF [candidate division WOR-3 bacterium]